MKVFKFGMLALHMSVIAFAAGESQVTRVDPAAFRAFAEGGEGIVLDVRTPEEVAMGTIGNASVIDFHSKDFRRKLSLLPKDKPIYVFCRSGGRSGETTKILAKMGFKEVVDLKGGIGAWKQAGYPVTESQIGVGEVGAKVSSTEFEEVVSGDLPVLVAFQTNWCTPCREMKPVLDQFTSDPEISARVFLVDMDANDELAKRLGVEAVPTFLSFKAGKEAWRGSGILSLEELKEGVGIAD